MTHETYDSHAAYLLSMTPKQRAIYERGYRDFDLDSIVANDAMIECAEAMMAFTLHRRRLLLELGFRDAHALCVKLDAEARDWDCVAHAQRRLDRQLREEPGDAPSG